MSEGDTLKMLFPKSIRDLCEQAHRNAVAHGFYNDDIDEHLLFARSIALIHSELSEALEADRRGYRADWEAYDKYNGRITVEENFVRHIKDSVEDELADAVIRIFDYCGHAGIDLERHISVKMAYNTTRPAKHNKKY